MKLFTAENIRLIDELTMKNEPVASIDLMERAAKRFFNQFCSLFDASTPVCVVCGPGNNGGDALAVARMLKEAKYVVSVCLYNTGSLSVDCAVNKQRFTAVYPNLLNEQTTEFIPQQINKSETVIIDGLFGSGLSRPLSGLFLDVVNWINNSGCKVVSIDIPSGMFCEDNPVDNQSKVQANYTLTFQFPKLSFLLPEAGSRVGEWQMLDIVLNTDAIEGSSSEYFFTDKNFLQNKINNRARFSHKGTFGHVLLIAGSKGMAGASVLASRAALRSGAGLVTLHGPECNRVICQSSVPELIYSTDKNNDLIVGFPDLKNYKTIGIGCGLGSAPETASMLEKLFTELFSPCVIDADALNIISRNKHFMDLIPEKSILTPHPKEFDRLFGVNNSTWQRLQKAREIAKRFNVIIVLKGAYSVVVNADGLCYFNSSGNAGLATAGTGDVLTGILSALLAQGYEPLDAAILGVYLHGLAADRALNSQSCESMIAGDVIENIGNAFNFIRTNK
jgi:NAD(P)H-hydrate epimerase